MIFTKKFGFLLLKIGVPFLIVVVPVLGWIPSEEPELIPYLVAVLVFAILLTVVGLVTVLKKGPEKSKASFLTKDVSVPTAAILGLAIGTWAIADPNRMSRWLSPESQSWIVNLLRGIWGPYLGALLILWGLVNVWWLVRKRIKHNQSSEVTASSRTSS